MESIFLHYLTAWKPLALAAVFFGIVIEGDMVMFTAAFLTHQGLFNVGEMLLLTMAATHAGDWGWYGLGRLVCRPGAAVERWVCRLAGPLDQRLAKDPSKVIFVSKFAYGLNHLTLLRAGAVRIAARVFARGDMPAATLWVLTIGSLGYFAGASSALLKSYIRYSELGLLAGLLIFAGLRWLLGRKLKRS